MNIPSTTPGMHRRAHTMIRRLAAVSAMALTGFGLSVPAASAGESERIRTKGGILKFEADGDVLRVLDTRRDGYAVRARATWFDPTDNTLQKAFLTDPNSKGRSKAKRLPIPEGITVRLKLCYVDNTGPVSCSKEQDGVA
jgi:hypothetical protein